MKRFNLEPTIVVTRRPRVADPAAYKSGAGDPRRQGRAAEHHGAAAVTVFFHHAGARIEARLGVVTVGEITIDPNGAGYFWSCALPMTDRSTPRPVPDLATAQLRIENKVREWCEAAKLICVRRGKF